jgi:hypothetical protein
VNWVDPLGLCSTDTDGSDEDPLIRVYEDGTQQIIRTARRAARDAEPAISGINGCIDAFYDIAASGMTGFSEGSGGAFSGGRSGVGSSGGRPALKGDSYHPDSVEARIKPPYEVNPQHVPGSSFVPGKTPLPPDAE